MQESMLEQLWKLLKQKQSKAFYAEKLGLTLEQLEVLWNEVKNKNQETQEEESNSLESFKQEENFKNGTSEIKFNTEEAVKSLEDLIRVAKIDTDKWEVISYTQNYWGTSATPHWQVKAKLEAKKQYKEDILAEVISKYKSTYKPFSAKDLFINKDYTRPCSLYISMTDVHINKTTIDEQSIEHKVEQFINVVTSLVVKTYRSHNIEEIVYPLGHDFFNTDTYFNTTTNGTQQDNNCAWDKAYELGFDAQVKVIKLMKQFCKTLHIKHVPSNHSRLTEYYLVHALEMYFKNDPSIVFDRTSESTKVYVYGENFIGMHHGDTKLEALPLYFASKFYKEWGSAKHKEIGVGDKHHSKSLKLNIADTEIQGIRVFMTPSLGGHGLWDKYKMYDNTPQCGIARVYDKEKGIVSIFQETV